MTPKTMQKLRRYHLYLGMFFAPAILLFALSGALQTFRLQEEKGWGSEPPGWIVWMASVHKDSKLPKAKPAEAGDHKPAPKAAPKPPQGPPPFKLPMQIFVTLLSIGLIFSTILGIAIALNNRALRKMSLGMLAAGTLLPLLLLML
ncbi:MAG: hypothetical protein ACAH11_15785 [Sphingomonas sp.]